MKLINLFIIIIIFSGLIKGQNNKTYIYTPGQIKYYEDFTNFLDNNGEARLDVFIQVPFTEIQFVRSSDGYTSGYSVTISIYKSDKKTLVIEKVWNEKIHIATFEGTSSKTNYNLSYRSFNLTPGKYFIKTTVTDRESQRESSSSNEVEVKDLSAKPSISDIMLISKKTTVDNKDKVIPNVSGNISESEGKIKLYFEIYSDSLIQSNIEYDVLTNDRKLILEKSGEQLLNKGKTQIYFTISDTVLGIGHYLVEVKLRSDKDSVIATTLKPFYSRWVGLPPSVENIDEAIAQLEYIANPEELDYMKAGKNEDEKTSRFLEFWKKKDPSPGNDENEVFEEYYRRVRFANEHFSHYSEGWKSDRGMVYIILGAPNNIDRHPFEYDSKPYVIWQYYELNKNFTFVDQTGFGDYRLLTPLYGDLFRYRY